MKNIWGVFFFIIVTYESQAQSANFAQGPNWLQPKLTGLLSVGNVSHVPIAHDHPPTNVVLYSLRTEYCAVLITCATAAITALLPERQAVRPAAETSTWICLLASLVASQTKATAVPRMMAAAATAVRRPITRLGSLLSDGVAGGRPLRLVQWSQATAAAASTVSVVLLLVYAIVITATASVLTKKADVGGKRDGVKEDGHRAAVVGWNAMAAWASFAVESARAAMTVCSTIITASLVKTKTIMLITITVVITAMTTTIGLLKRLLLLLNVDFI